MVGHAYVKIAQVNIFFLKKIDSVFHILFYV